MMDYKDPEKVLAICNAASKGPWTVKTNRHPETSGESWGWIDGPYENWCWSDKRRQSRSDAQFIALARTALPYWVERARQLEAELLIVNADNEWLRGSLNEIENFAISHHESGPYLEADEVKFCLRVQEIAEQALSPSAGKDLLERVQRLEAVAEAAKEAFKQIDKRTRTLGLDMSNYHPISIQVKPGDKEYWQAVWAYNKALAALEGGAE